MKICAVTCVKNEGPFILEWVAFGRMIGVTDFLFYSNDCDDGTDDLLDEMQQAGIVTHLPNPATGRQYQVEALRHARQHPLVTGADWLWNADVDEFLNIHIGNGTIAELIAACGAPDAISVTHQHFANNAVDAFEDAPVIGQFTRSHHPDIWCDRLEIEVKTLLRTGFPASYFGAHRPFLREGLKEKDFPRWTDGSGRPVPHNFLVNKGKGRRQGFRARGTREFATLNHYVLRSLESYLVKSDRGDVNRDFRFFDDTYWVERNDNGFHDTSIQRHLPALNDEIDRLRAMGGIGAAHDKCVCLHREKIARLMTIPQYRDLRQALLNAPAYPAAETAVIALLEAEAVAP